VSSVPVAVLLAVLLALSSAFAPRATAGGPATTLILRPGVIDVSAGGSHRLIPAPGLLDLADLVRLVDDDSVAARLPGGAVRLQAPIDQRPGSRLAISEVTVPEVLLDGGACLSGSGALLSVNGVVLLASGRAAGSGAGRLPAVIGYRGASSVRMSRVRVDDGRATTAQSPAGPVIEVRRGAQVHLSSVVVSRGAGIRLDDAHPGELTGVQISSARGAGLSVTGSTQLRLRDVTVSASSGDGLVLTGHGVRVRTDGVIRSVGNAGLPVRLAATHDLTLADLGVRSAGPVPGPSMVNVPELDGVTARDGVTASGGTLLRPARETPARGGARLPLGWVLGAGLLVLLAGGALELLRARRDPIPAGLAPQDVPNQR
jgi:hypothetical protein